MAREADGADLERLLAERGSQLMRAAIALTGSRQAGEDLLQAALERVLRKPRQVDDDTEGYLRRVPYNLAADGWRRRGRWRQRLPLLRSQEIDGAADGTAIVDLRDALVRLLCELPPGQRAVIVLRRTYLPVRVSVAWRAQVVVWDYRWLPPTKANLAALHAAVSRATIPSGFRRLPPGELPLPGAAQTGPAKR